MINPYNRLIFFAAVVSSFVLFNCTSTQPVPRYTKKSVSVPAVSQSSIVLPEGWKDITRQSSLPSVILWIANQDYSASMTLKEFQADDSTKKLLLKEDACFIANISLRLKLADDAVQRRITRTPELVATLTDACTYVYEEKGLLHRVIVYKKKEKYFELELSQENPSRQFDWLTSEQINLVQKLK